MVDPVEWKQQFVPKLSNRKKYLLKKPQYKNVNIKKVSLYQNWYLNYKPEEWNLCTL